MSFELKNAKATYQRVVNKMLESKIGDTIEVYADNILVKSIKASNHLAILVEMFNILRKHNMKLKPSKYAFEVSSGKYLG